MSFDLTPENLSAVLKSALGVQPNVVVTKSGLLVCEPLPLKVLVMPSPYDDVYVVRLNVTLYDDNLGAAYAAANEVNASDVGGATALTALNEPGAIEFVCFSHVSGPISPGLDFATAIEAVLNCFGRFQSAFGSIAARHEAIQRHAVAPAPAQEASASIPTTAVGAEGVSPGFTGPVMTAAAGGSTTPAGYL